MNALWPVQKVFDAPSMQMAPPLSVWIQKNVGPEHEKTLFSLVRMQRVTTKTCRIAIKISFNALQEADEAASNANNTLP